MQQNHYTEEEKYWCNSEGLQGRSYAIPTMEGFENIGPAVSGSPLSPASIRN